MLFRSNDTATTEIYTHSDTLSLHDALPIYPLGPRLGCPMNITAFGNADRLDVGIALDPAAFADPGMLVDCLGEAFANYRAAAGDGPTTSKV